MAYLQALLANHVVPPGQGRAGEQTLAASVVQRLQNARRVRADTDELETHPQEQFAPGVGELEVTGVVKIERIYRTFE